MVFRVQFIKGEALQSWVYRCLLVNGITDFSSVINSNGNWRLGPYFPVKHTNLFTFPPDSDLLNLFLESSIGLKSMRIDSLWNYATEIKKYLTSGSEYMQPGGSVAIYYCTLCIRESIISHGFGYIKSAWIYGDHCEIHNFNLVSLQSKSREDALLLLSSVLSGKADTKKSVIRKYRLPPMNFIENNNFMPCLIMDFYWTASNKCNKYFPEHSHHDFFHFNGKRKHINNFDHDNGSSLLHFARNKLREYSYRFTNELEKFFMESADVVNYDFGIREPDSLSVDLVMVKERDCSKCYRWSKDQICPINPIITAFKLYDETEAVKPRRNPCDRFIKYGYLRF